MILDAGYLKHDAGFGMRVAGRKLRGAGWIAESKGIGHSDKKTAIPDTRDGYRILVTRYDIKRYFDSQAEIFAAP